MAHKVPDVNHIVRLSPRPPHFEWIHGPYTIASTNGATLEATMGRTPVKPNKLGLGGMARRFVLRRVDRAIALRHANGPDDSLNSRIDPP